MCGIIRYLGSQNAAGILLEGLKCLEYRGYDSSGLAIVQNGNLAETKRVGRVKELISAVNQTPVDATLGICHTRWATLVEITETGPLEKLVWALIKDPDNEIKTIHNRTEDPHAYGSG